MDSVSVWEGIFMLVVLKIPVAYLAVVVWWAIRAEPTQGGSDPVGVLVPLTPCGWDDWRRSAAARARSGRPVGPRWRGPRPRTLRSAA